MLEALPISEKLRHVRQSYDLSVPKNKSWEVEKFVCRDETGEPRLGKLLRIEPGEKSPVYFYDSDVPTTYVPQTEEGWSFVAMDTNGKLTERYYTPLESEVKEERYNDVRYFPTEHITLEKGMIFRFLAHPYAFDGRVSIFRHTEPENADPIAKDVIPGVDTKHSEKDIKRFDQLIELLENGNKFFDPLPY